MTTEQLQEIRNNQQLRDEYLISLTRRNKKFIYNFSKRIVGKLATYEIISGECTQYFMLGANRGIDQARINDDGRGKNDPEKYFIYLGSQTIRDFLMKEFHCWSKRKIVFESFSLIHHDDRSNEDIARDIIDKMNIDEIISKLKPLDRKILNIILYGE